MKAGRDMKMFEQLKKMKIAGPDGGDQHSSASTVLPKRKDIPEDLKWDLTQIYKTDEEWEAEFSRLSGAMDAPLAYAGRLGENVCLLYDALSLLDSQQEILLKLYNYAHLKHDEDIADSKNAGRLSQIEALMSDYFGKVAFVEPELSAIGEEVLEAFMNEDERLEVYRFYFEEIRRKKSHMLSEREESLLGRAGQIFDTASNVFGILNDADLKFPKVELSDGTKVQLSHGMYSKLMEDPDQRVRRDCFKAYYSVYRQFCHTLAGTLSAEVKTNNYLTAVRGYQTARERAMFTNDIPESVYDNLTGAINDRIGLLHRYVALRKRALGLKEVHSYDLYAPIVGEVDYKLTYEEAKKTVLEALAPMGEEYLGVVQTAFDKGWIDVCENENKRSGAYSSGTFGTPPYILLNWRDTINMMYTLIHELGHSVHSWYSRSSQPFIYSDYSIFLAEIASTTNENLLTAHLLEKAEDPSLRSYILAHYLDGFRGTVFRQTQFAEFEHLIYEADREGRPLTAEFLCEEYGKMNARYYGPELVADEEISYEWSRIPHFYYNYYVYQYATGFSAATAFSKMIREGGEEAVERYKGFLKAGSSKPPIEVLKDAGLDMTGPEPVYAALEVFEGYLDELEKVFES